MEKDILEIFCSATEFIISSVTGEKPKIGAIQKLEVPCSILGFAAVIDLSGQITGSIILDVTPEIAKSIATAQLNGMEIDDSEMLLSSMMELTNMISGKTASLIDPMKDSVQITPPLVLHGKHNLTKHFKTVYMILIEMAAGMLTLNLCLDKLESDKHVWV